MEKRLSVRLRGHPIGVLTQDQHGQLSFSYDQHWMQQEGAEPISLSLSFDGNPFEDKSVQAFFGGYLPEGREARAQIARHFGISANSTFRMLGAVGRDCAGALSLYPMDEQAVEDVAREPACELLDEVDLASALRELERRPLLAGPGRLRLSLAGAQSKTAVYVTAGGEIALTKDDYPSTHIIKPALRHAYEDLELIEYFCLELGRRLGLRAPDAHHGEAQGIPYLLIERYDRLRDEQGRIRRLHQEDFCQAMGVAPGAKYEWQGGPTLAQCFALCDRLRRPAIERLRLLDVVIFNFLIGNADAHGKNFSVLYSAHGPELAPLYDVVSTLVYEADRKLDLDARMAMRIAREYDSERIRPSHWKRMAEETGFAWPAMRARIEALSRAIQSDACELEREFASRSMTTPILHRAVDLILERTRRIRETHGFTSVRPEELPARLKYIGLDERLTASDDIALSRTDDERVAFERRFRRAMTRLWEAQRRAGQGGQPDEERQLVQLERELTEAHRAWHAGATLTRSLAKLLREHVGRLPGDPPESAEADAEAHRESRDMTPTLARSKLVRDQRVTAAEDSVLTAAHLAWPHAIVLCAVPSEEHNLIDEFLSKASPLLELLSAPPRWRKGGWDLFSGREVERKRGDVLRVATPRYGCLEVWKDGTISAAFAPWLDRVQVDGRERSRLNGLALAERLYLFGELVDAVARVSPRPFDAVQFSLRMRKLRGGEPPLVLGPAVPGTFGWQFGSDLHSPEVDQITADEVWPADPVDSGKMAYSLLRHVYLGFATTMDDLPFTEVRDATPAVSKEAFLAYIDNRQG